MRNFIKSVVLVLGFGALLAGPAVALVSPDQAFAARDVKTCEVRLLGIPPWYRGLVTVDASDQCAITSPENSETGLSTFIWKIVLNVIEIVLVLVSYLAFFFILYGGFQFLTGGSNSGTVEKARKTILNAVIGLAISMASIALTNLIFGVLG